MKTCLIIGAGSAGSVVIQKCLEMTKVFSTIHVATRTLATLNALKQNLNLNITTHQCDADDTQQVIQLIKKTNPYCLINMALPYQDLTIMQACLETKTHYIDTANYEPKDKAEFCYKWQWDYHQQFKQAGIMALLGAGFDPGVTNVFCAYAQKHLFDSIDTIDIIDCNAGDHKQPFATNFNPEINIREITQQGKFYKDNQWHTTKPLSQHQSIYFPQVGHKTAYLMYHEELESLAKHIPNVKSLRFWMTFSDQYLTYLDVLQNIGLTQITPIDFQGQSIIPLQFLKALLPNPASLAKNYEGKTCIGCVITGQKNNKPSKKIIYNICHHQDAFSDCQAQAVGYTTGVPTAVAAQLLCTGQWLTPGVINIEQCNPDPFLDILPNYGLSWTVADYDHTIT